MTRNISPEVPPSPKRSGQGYRRGGAGELRPFKNSLMKLQWRLNQKTSEKVIAIVVGLELGLTFVCLIFGSLLGYIFTGCFAYTLSKFLPFKFDDIVKYVNFIFIAVLILIPLLVCLKFSNELAIELKRAILVIPIIAIIAYFCLTTLIHYLSTT